MKILNFLSYTIILSLCSIAQAESAQETTEEATAINQKMVVSIGSFKNKTSAPNEMFDTLIDRITNSIINSRKFEVVDNSRIKELISEQKKIDMGLSEDGVAAPKKGKIKMAGFVIYGNVMQLGLVDKKHSGDGYSSNKMVATVEIDLRITDAETGHAMASKTVKATKSIVVQETENSTSDGNFAEGLVQDVIQKAAQDVTEDLIDLSFPSKIIKVNKKSVVINMTKERAKKGMLLAVYEIGEEMIDPDTGDSLGNEGEEIGRIKIKSVSPKVATAVPVGKLEIDELEVGMIVRRVDDSDIQQEQDSSYQKAKASFKNKF